MITTALFILMPLIATVAGVKIYMYFKDHNPPHFHAKYGDKEDLYDIEGNLMDGDLGPQKRKRIIKWAKNHQDFLKDQWDNHQQ